MINKSKKNKQSLKRSDGNQEPIESKVNNKEWKEDD